MATNLTSPPFTGGRSKLLGKLPRCRSRAELAQVPARRQTHGKGHREPRYEHAISLT